MNKKNSDKTAKQKGYKLKKQRKYDEKRRGFQSDYFFRKLRQQRDKRKLVTPYFLNKKRAYQMK